MPGMWDQVLLLELSGVGAVPSLCIQVGSGNWFRVPHAILRRVLIQSHSYLYHLLIWGCACQLDRMYEGSSRSSGYSKAEVRSVLAIK